MKLYCTQEKGEVAERRSKYRNSAGCYEDPRGGSGVDRPIDWRSRQRELP